VSEDLVTPSTKITAAVTKASGNNGNHKANRDLGVALPNSKTRAAGPTFGFTKVEFAAWLDGTFQPDGH
jgi:hypothetical protein